MYGRSELGTYRTDLRTHPAAKHVQWLAPYSAELFSSIAKSGGAPGATPPRPYQLQGAMSHTGTAGLPKPEP